MAKERKILFFDDFNGNELDTKKWCVEVTEESCDLKKRYTNRKENVFVKDSNLVLTARREKHNGGEYTSASVTTNGKFSFLYGRAEMRAKLPYGEGIWPAFWTLGDDYIKRGDHDGWPYAGEIDIMEFIGVGGEEYRNNLEGSYAYGCDVYMDGKMGNNRSTCNLHWGKDRDNHESCGAEYCLPKGIFADDYHIFAIEWTKNSIEWFVDDVKIHEMDINREDMVNAFHKPHWLLVNLGLVEGWGPEVKNITPFPQGYYIDYIKVYESKD